MAEAILATCGFSAAATMDPLLFLSRMEAMRRPDTFVHSQRVADRACRVALEAGLPEAWARRLRAAASVHDIGKMAVPETILDKRGPLTPSEWEQIRSHSRAGHGMLRQFDSPALGMTAEVALYHHEAFDGSGYPFGLAGEAIPLSARIVAICDVYDALRSRRQYKQPMTHDEAISVILDGDGRVGPEKFCPTVLEVFLRAMPSAEIRALAA